MSDDALELNGDLPGERRRKRTSPQEKLASSNATVRVEGHFQIAFENRWGFSPMLKEARDRKLLKKYIEQWGEDVTVRLIHRFFLSTDPRITACRFYDVADFAYWAPTLRLAEQGNDVSRQTAANVHEISKAMGRK